MRRFSDFELRYSVLLKQFVTTLTQGAGYGGGASYKDNEGETLGVGLAGVALIEIGEIMV